MRLLHGVHLFSHHLHLVYLLGDCDEDVSNGLAMMCSTGNQLHWGNNSAVKLDGSPTGMLVFAASTSLVLELSADTVQQLVEAGIAWSRPKAPVLVVHGHGSGVEGSASLADRRAVGKEAEAGEEGEEGGRERREIRIGDRLCCCAGRRWQWWSCGSSSVDVGDEAVDVVVEWIWWRRRDKADEPNAQEVNPKGQCSPNPALAPSESCPFDPGFGGDEALGRFAMDPCTSLFVARWKTRLCK